MKRIIITILLILYSINLIGQTKYCGKIDGEQIIKKEYLTISYNKNKKIPNYVGYYLTKKNLTGTVKRESKFHCDQSISPLYQSRSSDYINSGYDRGHMSPAGDWKFSWNAMYDSFSMSNICPQKPQLNRIYWKYIEEQEREYIKKCDTLFVISGSICNNYSTIKNRIYVPTYFYKTIIGVYNHKVIINTAWLFKNSDEEQSPNSHKTTIKVIESIINKDLYQGFWFNGK